MIMIQIEQTERVVWVTLNRPKLNILNIAMLRELNEALSAIAEYRDSSVVVLSAADDCKAFSAGVDIADHTPDKLAEMIEVFHGALRTLVRLPQATVAAITGSALGGGAELALACDLVVATDDAKIGFPEINLACFPPVAVATLPHLCGRAAASDLILTGEVTSARAAQRQGILSRVFEEETFTDQLRNLVAGLAKHSPQVLRLTAGLVRQRFLGEFEAALTAAEKAYLGDLSQLPDMAEGIQAFMDRRAPKWAE